MNKTNTIGNRVELIMIKVDMNYRSFGKKIGFSDVVVRNVIKGRNNPSYDFISNLIQTFDWIDHSWFITGKGEMYKRKFNYKNTDIPHDINESQPLYGDNSLTDKDKNDYLNLIISDQAKEIWELRQEITRLRAHIIKHNL